MRPTLAWTAIFAALLPLTVVSPTLAGPSQPPPPPANLVCKSCGAPPVPPTPVPTLAPTAGPIVAGIRVRLAASHVRRGHIEKVTIAAFAGDTVITFVFYRQGKSLTFRGKAGSRGKYSKSWKVGRSVPLGKSKVNVSVNNGPKPEKYSLDFVVTK
jgi:hypothetical protein